MTRKLILILIPLAIVAAALYWWFLMRVPAGQIPKAVTEETSPFGNFPTASTTSSTKGNGSGITVNPAPESSGITAEPLKPGEVAIPRLRHLSATPIGGYMATTTASTTLVRYIDRGAGHIYEASSLSLDIPKISNTTIPRVYESFWNKNASAAVFRYMRDDSGSIINFFGQILPVKQNASSTDSVLPFEIKGKFISNDIKELAVSPKGDRIFTFNVTNGKGTGYVSGFDESKKTQVLDIPLTQINIEWPEENTVAISTKASRNASGYLYLVDLKKPFLKKAIGGLAGLTAKVSPDAKRVLYSYAAGQSFKTSLFNLKDNSAQDIVFKTTTDKCVWSKLHPTDVYCAVPTNTPTGIYPDDWYKGTVAFTDQIWHLDTTTGEVTLMSNLLKDGGALIDVINPTLDPSENFLYFVNKRDLTLWSLDLTE
jgi:hypothetical protein